MKPFESNDTDQYIDCQLEARIEALEAALQFYANPETYHAITILGDPPCGDFTGDFSADEWTKECGYDRPMPGKRARAALDQDAGE